jgi:2-keto-4-pentenoate hydratase
MTAVREATVSGTPCSPVRDLIGRDDVTTAYAVQRLLTEERVAAGGVVVGRKIGQVVLSGALGPMVAVSSGTRVRTEITGLGAVEVVFS